jgi:CHAT domain
LIELRRMLDSNRWRRIVVGDIASVNRSLAGGRAAVDVDTVAIVGRDDVSGGAGSPVEDVAFGAVLSQDGGLGVAQRGRPASVNADQVALDDVALRAIGDFAAAPLVAREHVAGARGVPSMMLSSDVVPHDHVGSDVTPNDHIGSDVAPRDSLVLSLWEVDDRATSLLMTRFYQNWLGRRKGMGKPMTKAGALREAKEWLRGLSAAEVGSELDNISRGDPRSKVGEPVAGERFDHPRYWAAFILIGDPS